ncbi:MAG TPA: hypothetical protein VFQ36_01730 [Ktedonobacteraceae bacterium]|nr:hypothetical protein [Ktedonobacteraceae bacterium]
MKKSLIVALAICLLFLGGCSAATGSSAPASQKTATVTTTSPQIACRVLQAQRVRIGQEIQTASSQLSAAHGDQNIVRQAEQTLIRLHWVLAQGQASLQACKTS